MNKKYCIFLIILILKTFSGNEIHAQFFQQSAGKWELLVDGKPFAIKGVTFGFNDQPERFDSLFQDLQFLGVNSIRTWGTDAHTAKLLDVAHQYGIKVMVGIWMRHGRPGMEDDDRFDYLEDTAGMNMMYKSAIETVEQFKAHPAVLSWGVGNEVYLNLATDAEKEAYSIFLESVCSTIKSIDPDHPITSVEAWTFGLDWWQKYVPSVDIYGLNSYGRGADLLQAELTKRGIDKPYIVTEFGVTGEWDAPTDQNGVKTEPSDDQKYDAIVTGFRDWIEPKPACLGVFVFHYSNGTDFGASWLLTHFNGLKRSQYWAIREAFTGQKPMAEFPKIVRFQLPDTLFNSGSWVPVDLQLSDAAQGKLTINFYYNQRTGSRKRRNQLNPLAFRGDPTKGYDIQLPQENGAVKIYVTVQDTNGNLGIATTSIQVKDEQAAKRKYLVPKAKLPFYVYRDNENLPYYPSGYMGNYKAIAVDLNQTEEVYSGKTAIKISYHARNDWYGVAFVDPANDWGDILGGYDISGAKSFSFWAKANDTNVKITIGFGLIDQDKPFPDSGKKSTEITLTTEWKHYSIRIKKTDVSCIRSGLVLFSAGNGFAHDIYLDEVVFE